MPLDSISTQLYYFLSIFSLRLKYTYTQGKKTPLRILTRATGFPGAQGDNYVTAYRDFKAGHLLHRLSGKDLVCWFVPKFAFVPQN